MTVTGAEEQANLEPADAVIRRGQAMQGINRDKERESGNCKTGRTTEEHQDQL